MNDDNDDCSSLSWWLFLLLNSKRKRKKRTRRKKKKKRIHITHSFISLTLYFQNSISNFKFFFTQFEFFIQFSIFIFQTTLVVDLFVCLSVCYCKFTLNQDIEIESFFLEYINFQIYSRSLNYYYYYYFSYYLSTIYLFYQRWYLSLYNHTSL